jgi:hypothetical protein
MKKVLVVLAVVSFFGLSVLAQEYNIKVTSVAVNKMAYDSLRFSPSFNVGDYENIAVIAKATIQDSACVYFGWQRGYKLPDGNTYWKRPWVVIDTMNTATAGNFQVKGNCLGAGNDSDLVQAIDTIGTGGATYMINQIQPKWSPVARIVAKGLGNSNKHTWYNLFFDIDQRRYVRTNQNQPDN